MKVKAFDGAPEIVERLVNHWLVSKDGPGEVIRITQSQSARQSGNVDLTLFVFYKTKEEVRQAAAKMAS